MKTEKSMSLTRILPTIALIVTLAAPTVVSAQVPVEVSTERVVSGGRVYYMHEVQKNQTLYSIAKAYRVSVDALTRENVIPPNGIQTGQVLRVPAPDQQASAASQPRPVAQQAAAGPQPRPATQPSRPALTSGVPGIDISGEKIVSGGKTFYMHQVQKGQTLYSIAKAYRVTLLDIDRENSIPPGGIQAGQVLKIPASSSLAVIEEQTPPAETAATPDRSTTAATTAPRGNTAAGTNLPRQETPRQETQQPRQETARQETQLPRQEQPAARPATDGGMTTQTTEYKTNADVKTQTATKTQPEADTQQQAQQQAPSTGKSDDKSKPAQPGKKKVHKVQKGESLAEIAKKYDITVQELKQANKGVIFAMPDMRLVIPVKEEE